MKKWALLCWTGIAPSNDWIKLLEQGDKERGGTEKIQRKERGIRVREENGRGGGKEGEEMREWDKG